MAYTGNKYRGVNHYRGENNYRGAESVHPARITAKVTRVANNQTNYKQIALHGCLRESATGIHR